MKVKKLLLKALYCLNGDYISFPQNPLHNKFFENANVKMGKRIYTIGGNRYEVDVISIDGHEPIDCELVSRRSTSDGTMVLSICQDWG